jgi:uncharacterized protein GlcG (DUF336 family)
VGGECVGERGSVVTGWGMIGGRGENREKCGCKGAERLARR